MTGPNALRTCGECGCEFCFTATARAVSTRYWHVVLECPNCWMICSQIVDDEALDEIESALDDDIRMLASQLDQAGRSSMESDVARMVAALRADAILPMDF
jgi:hypothetical protein